MNTKDINIDLLSTNAFNYLNNHGYWAKHDEKEYVKRRNKEVAKLKEFDANILAKEYACISGDRRILLNNWSDIGSIFGDYNRYSMFINYLFERIISEKTNGLHPLTYYSRGAILTLDYRYILETFFKFGVEILKFDDENFRIICREFQPKFSNYNAFNKQNFFIISAFNMHRNTLNMNNYFETYYNALIVKNEEIDEHLGFMGIALREARILDVLEKSRAIRFIKLLSNDKNYFKFSAFVNNSNANAPQFLILNL